MIRSASSLGILSALAASLAFSVNDAAVKFLAADYPLHQVVLIRSMIGLIVIVTLFLPAAGGVGALRTRRPLAHALRAGCVLMSNLFFFTGLGVLPLAEAVAIFFVAPLLITALSVLVLAEKVGPWRWGAVGLGMTGACIVMRPGAEAFQPAALLVLLSALAYATMHMFTRRMGSTEPAVTMAFWVQIAFVVSSTAVGLVAGDGRFDQSDEHSILTFLLRAWVWPPTHDWGFFLLVGVANGLSGILIGQAYRLCEAGLIAPFEYLALPLGVLFGLVVFGEWPDSVALTGIAMIMAAGLVTAWRETRRGRH